MSPCDSNCNKTSMGYWECGSHNVGMSFLFHLHTPANRRTNDDDDLRD